MDAAGRTGVNGWGYTHDGRANKDPYPHDRRADKDSYPHDRMWLTICVA